MEHNRIPISELDSHAGKQVMVSGFVDRVRDIKKVVFVVVRDRTGLIQATVDVEAAPKEVIETSRALTPESVVTITGKLLKNTAVKLRGLEIIPEKIEIASLATSPLPIDEKTNQPDRMDWRFLDLRSEKNRLIFEVQTTVEAAMREYWIKQNFIEIHSPKLMASPSESGAELFEVKHFEGRAFLAQSPQFYKQMAIAAGFEKVFEVGPVFRAEKSHTVRHATEFTSVDMEMAWISSLEDVMQFEEQWLIYVLKTVKEKHGEKIKEHFGIDMHIPKTPFPRIPMSEAQEILKKEGHKTEREGDLDPEAERKVSEYVEKKFKHEFVFVTDWPVSVRPFYHMRNDDDQTLTKSYDLLWKGIEVTTGAQREHRIDILEKQAKEKGLPLESVKIYLDFFKYGMPPHGGFGFGLSRMLMQLVGAANIREVTFLHRDSNRLTP